LKSYLKHGGDSVGAVLRTSSRSGNHVSFFTIYDGPFDKYTRTRTISGRRSISVPLHKNPPPTPTSKNAATFSQWVQDHDLKPLAFYCGYPGLQVQDVRALLADEQAQVRHEDPGPARHPGIIVRYRMPMVRYYLLQVDNPAGAGALLGRLAGEGGSDGPHITAAHDGVAAPVRRRRTRAEAPTDYCLNSASRLRIGGARCRHCPHRQPSSCSRSDVIRRSKTPRRSVSPDLPARPAPGEQAHHPDCGTP
jgi:hypothetical protein